MKPTPRPKKIAVVSKQSPPPKNQGQGGKGQLRFEEVKKKFEKQNKTKQNRIINNAINRMGTTSLNFLVVTLTFVKMAGGKFRTKERGSCTKTRTEK
jgi:hypothetical protein